MCPCASFRHLSLFFFFLCLGSFSYALTLIYGMQALLGFFFFCYLLYSLSGNVLYRQVVQVGRRVGKRNAYPLRGYSSPCVCVCVCVCLCMCQHVGQVVGR